MRFPERINRVRSQFPLWGIEALLFVDIKNIRYLAGFSGSEGALLLSQDRLVLLVDGRYVNQAEREVGQVEVFEYQDKMEGLSAVLSGAGVKRIGFESATLDVETHTRLKERLPELTFLPLGEEVRSIRAVKDEAEIALIKKAVAVATRSLAETCALIKPGSRERDIAIELDFRMRRNGAEGVSFPTIVASGENSALPHAAPGMREIRVGDALVVDYGAVVDGYHSDETCTFFVGEPDEKQRALYEMLKAAHDRAIEAIMAGVACREIDRTARDFLMKRDVGSYFSHGTGHGVGLDVHEAPRLSEKSTAVLEAGMVVTVEPGIYIPDLWGIRIEDMILVKQDGHEVLTKTPKDLRPLY